MNNMDLRAFVCLESPFRKIINTPRPREKYTLEKRIRNNIFCCYDGQPSFSALTILLLYIIHCIYCYL